MPKKIPKDFQPSEQSLLNLRKHGVLPDFVEDQLPGFITYWAETNKKKASWQMTLQVWMRRAHQGKAGREWEANRHIRNRYSVGQKNDLFDGILGNLQNTKRGAAVCGRALPRCEEGTVNGKESSNPRYSQPIARSLPTMSTDEALAELAKLRKRL